jgi:RNA polymerase sigma-70 factor (ECF subfamily)
MVTGDLLARARAGDGEAFRELAGSHRRELQVHCYRMLGSFADAEDAVQETMLAAWQGIGGFTEERASLRTWLYKIATSRCLNARRAASRRPARQWDMSQFEAPVPTPRDEAVWLQPFPDALLEGAAGRPLGPEARYEQSEAISLAFVTALQLLPPRQLAVLILRDVTKISLIQVSTLSRESRIASGAACGGGHCACKSGSGIRSPSRSKPAPISATAKAPPHQMASGEVASRTPPAAGPRATPAVKERP